MKSVREFTETCLSDEEVAILVRGKARQLLEGEKTRDELREDLVKLVAAEPGVVTRVTPLLSQGRCSFGRENAGRKGIGLFVFENPEQR